MAGAQVYSSAGRRGGRARLTHSGALTSIAHLAEALAASPDGNAAGR
ncbi:MAG: hypothetical protein U1F45_04405 [Burkholderiales bacterium]